MTSAESSGPGAAAPAADPKALLAAANGASDKVAALHIVFLAICAYLLVIAFGTTDLDLLIGKSVKLPVVDVEVPIVGFYALAPYLLVLVHFNLLLALQLLSRKLYVFDAAARGSGEASGLHEQLSIFPYNHYLIGRPSRLVGGFLALVIGITMLLLPVAALLTLQARFLAYQSEAVTWVQRLAVWLDAGLVVILWPVIMSRSESWSAYVGAVWRHARHRWLRWLWGAGGLLIVLGLLAREVSWRAASTPPPLVPGSREYLAWLTEPWLFKLLVAWLLAALVARPLRYGARRLSGGRDVPGRDEGERLAVGAPGLLVVLLAGSLLPLALVTAGETLDRPAALSTRILASLRHLDLRERVVVARPLAPDALGDLRSGDRAREEGALRFVQRVDLRGRSLLQADFANALLPKADLRDARLQGARMVDAYLQGADLQGAQLLGTYFVGARMNGANLHKADLRGTVFVEVWLEGANLSWTQMQGTLLEEVQLQGANLSGARLQGTNLSHVGLREADLSGAGLQGAKLRRSDLEGANFSRADLRGASLSGSSLHGAELSGAQLQGADLSGARLQGVSLKGAELRGASLRSAVLYTESPPGFRDLELIDARGLKWRPLDAEEIRSIGEEQAAARWLSSERRKRYEAATRRAALTGLKPPAFWSCARDGETQVACEGDLPLAQVKAAQREELEKVQEMLEGLACASASTARTYVYNPFLPGGFAVRLQARARAADGESCPGLARLSPVDRARLSERASMEEAQRN